MLCLEGDTRLTETNAMICGSIMIIALWTSSLNSTPHLRKLISMWWLIKTSIHKHIFKSNYSDSWQLILEHDFSCSIGSGINMILFLQCLEPVVLVAADAICFCLSLAVIFLVHSQMVSYLRSCCILFTCYFFPWSLCLDLLKI